MRYNISLKLIECLNEFVTNTKTIESKPILLDLIAFDFPIHPLSTPNKLEHATIEVSNDVGPVKIKLNISPTLSADEKLTKTIKKTSSFLPKNGSTSDCGDLFEFLSLINELRNINFEFNDNGQVSYLTANLDIEAALNDLPPENVREIIFATTTKLNTLLNKLIK